MTRALMPGRWNAHGRAVPDTQLHEMDCEIAHDADRVIQPPIAPPEPNHRARALRWAWAAVIAGYVLLAALLKLAGARSFN